MARCLNSDPIRKKNELPIIFLEHGVYLVGLIKYKVVLNDEFRLRCPLLLSDATEVLNYPWSELKKFVMKPDFWKSPVSIYLNIHNSSTVDRSILYEANFCVSGY